MGTPYPKRKHTLVGEINGGEFRSNESSDSYHSTRPINLVLGDRSRSCDAPSRLHSSKLPQALVFDTEESAKKGTLTFIRSHYKEVIFWLFLPITLPLLLLKAFVDDIVKVRHILVLIMESMIMQLELICQMMKTIRNSTSDTIEIKIEKMSRSFHVLNMFNPLNWIGMFLYYVDESGKTMNEERRHLNLDRIHMALTAPHVAAISPKVKPTPGLVSTTNSGNQISLNNSHSEEHAPEITCDDDNYDRTGYSNSTNRENEKNHSENVNVIAGLETVSEECNSDQEGPTSIRNSHEKLDEIDHISCRPTTHQAESDVRNDAVVSDDEKASLIVTENEEVDEAVTPT